MAEGIFVGLSEADILAIRDRAKADVTALRAVTGYTLPSGLSVTKSQLQNISSREILAECRYALQKLDPDTYGKDMVTTRTHANFV